MRRAESAISGESLVPRAIFELMLRRCTMVLYATAFYYEGVEIRKKVSLYLSACLSVYLSYKFHSFTVSQL